MSVMQLLGKDVSGDERRRDGLIPPCRDDLNIGIAGVDMMQELLKNRKILQLRVDPHGEEFQKIMQEIRDSQYVELDGFLCHIGRALPVRYRQFSDYPASFQPYAEVTAGLLKEALPYEREKIIVEPRTAWDGNTTFDCCSNQLGLICERNDIPFEIIQNGDRQRICVKNAIIVGNTCLEYDYIRKSVTGELGMGSFIRFENLGACIYHTLA